MGRLLQDDLQPGESLACGLLSQPCTSQWVFKQPQQSSRSQLGSHVTPSNSWSERLQKQLSDD